MTIDDSAAGAGNGSTEVDPFIGSVLAHRYRILRKLGTGATGSVYLAEHLTFGRLDAVKLLPPGSNDPAVIPRVLRGMRNVTSIRHPNVCTIYDVSPTADGWLFVAMEYIAGQSLKDLMDSEGALDPSRAAAIAIQIAAALQAAHDKGVIHRDLKPANVMIDQDAHGIDIVKVVDFDISKAVDALESEPESEITRHSFVIGTPEYMSPEQLLGDPLDGRSDLYALAVIVFRMLTGFLPIRSQTTQEIMVDRLTKPPLRLSDVAPSRPFPSGLEEFLARALARDKKDRVPSAADFARELQSIFGLPQVVPGQTAAALAARGGTAATAGATPVRSRIPMMAAFAGLLALVTVATVLFLNNRETAQPVTGDPVTTPPLASADTQSVPADSIQPLSTGNTSTKSDSLVPGPAPVPRSPAGPSADQLFAELKVMSDQVGPPYPASPELRAIARKAQTIYDQYEKLGPQYNGDRALAAYVAGLAWIGLEEVAVCATWMERAVRLDPENSGYRVLLSQCRDGG